MPSNGGGCSIRESRRIRRKRNGWPRRLWNKNIKAKAATRPKCRRMRKNRPPCRCQTRSASSAPLCAATHALPIRVERRCTAARRAQTSPTRPLAFTFSVLRSSLNDSWTSGRLVVDHFEFRPHILGLGQSGLVESDVSVESLSVGVETDDPQDEPVVADCLPSGFDQSAADSVAMLGFQHVQ